MYISRVEIDSENRRKIKDLTHLGAFHNWVEQSFPDEFDKDIRSRKLWRIDTLNNKNYLLLVSENEPNLSKLEKYGVSGTARCKSYDKYLDSLEEGKAYRFRVKLNPVVAVLNSEGRRGIVKPHITVEHQMEYLRKRAEANGFQLNECEIVNRGFETFRKKEQRAIRLVSVVYEGILTITDVEKIRIALTKGIGKKKAYGFGMMTIIRLED